MNWKTFERLQRKKKELWKQVYQKAHIIRDKTKFRDGLGYHSYSITEEAAISEALEEFEYEISVIDGQLASLTDQEREELEAEAVEHRWEIQSLIDTADKGENQDERLKLLEQAYEILNSDFMEEASYVDKNDDSVKDYSAACRVVLSTPLGRAWGETRNKIEAIKKGTDLAWYKKHPHQYNVPRHVVADELDTKARAIQKQSPGLNYAECCEKALEDKDLAWRYSQSAFTQE